MSVVQQNSSKVLYITVQPNVECVAGFLFFFFFLLHLLDRNSEDRQEITAREMGRHADQTQTWHMVACSPTELNQHSVLLDFY